MDKFSRVLGIDASKARLDGHVWPGGACMAWTNDEAGIAAILGHVGAVGAEAVAVEASGGCEKRLARGLRAAGVRVLVLDPARVRAFAKALGRQAKNDRVDAALIAEFGARFGGERPAPDPALEALAEHLAWYEHLAADLARWRTRAAAYEAPELRAALAARLAELKALKAAARRRLKELVAAGGELHRRVALMMTAPGVGFITAVTLAARLPELGAISHKKLAGLVGVAPWDDDSGKRKGRRRCKGGRADVRAGSFMAARTASRCNPVLAPFYERLRAKGKEPQVATVAVLRRLLVMLNAMLRDGRPWACA